MAFPLLSTSPVITAPTFGSSALLPSLNLFGAPPVGTSAFSQPNNLLPGLGTSPYSLYPPNLVDVGGPRFTNAGGFVFPTPPGQTPNINTSPGLFGVDGTQVIKGRGGKSFISAGGFVFPNPKSTRTKTPNKYLQGIGTSKQTGNLPAGPGAYDFTGGGGGGAQIGAQASAPTDPLAGLFTVAQLKNLTTIPKFTYTPVTAQQVVAPQIGYTSLDLNKLKTMPTDLSYLLKNWQNPFGPDVRSILNRGLRGYLNTLAGSANDLRAFQRQVANLPSLNPAARQAALAILNPQAASARQSALQSANFIRLLGNAAAGLQNQISGNVGDQIRQSGQALNLLAQGVSANTMAPLAQEIANSAQAGASPLAPGDQGGTLPGGLNINQIPGTAQQALNALRGTIPAESAAVQGPLASMLSASMAQQLQGGSQQQASMALAQGNQNVAQIMAQLPQVQSQQFGQLTQERNAELDRQLTILQQSGQINSQEAQAIWQNAQSQAQGIGQARTSANQYGLNVAQMQNQNLGANVQAWNNALIANNTGKNNVAQAQAQLNASVGNANASRIQQAQSTNQQLGLQAWSDTVSAQQRALGNMLQVASLQLKAKTATSGGKPMTAYQQAQQQYQMTSDLQAWSHGSLQSGTQTISQGPGQPQVVIRVPKTVPLNPAAAWRNFTTKYGPSFVQQYGQQNAENVMLGIFKAWFSQVPDNWTAQMVANNRGPGQGVGTVTGNQPNVVSLQPLAGQTTQTYGIPAKK